MKSFIVFVIVMLCTSGVWADTWVTIIEGLEGTPAYGEQFGEQTRQADEAARTITDPAHITTLRGGAVSRDAVSQHFGELAERLGTDDRLVVYLIGHGSYDGVEYKFNIPGPDLTDSDLIGLFDAIPARHQVIIVPGSASGALIEGLKNDNRILVTGTRSGTERLATRFAAHLFDALANPAADVNKNRAVSVREAFDFAERMVSDYFEQQGQLATEHAVLEGDTAAAFMLARAVPATRGADNAELAALLRERDAIDERIQALQLQKNDLASEDFLNQLQQLMIDLALVQGRIDETGGASP